MPIPMHLSENMQKVRKGRSNRCFHAVSKEYKTFFQLDRQVCRVFFNMPRFCMPVYRMHNLLENKDRLMCISTR